MQQRHHCVPASADGVGVTETNQSTLDLDLDKYRLLLDKRLDRVRARPLWHQINHVRAGTDDLQKLSRTPGEGRGGAEFRCLADIRAPMEGGQSE